MKQGSESTAAQGVQELIDRIRGEGVNAGREEGERILSEAKREAAALRAAAEAQARDTIARAREQIEREKAAGIEALKNAARDAMLELRGNVRAAFEQHVQRLVSAQMQDTGFVRSLILALAGHAADQFISDRDAVIFLSKELAGSPDAVPADPSVQEKIRNAVLGSSGAMLREGITLLPEDGVSGGARVRLVGQDLEIDLTDRTVTRLLLKHLLPRYQAIVEGDQS
jgi:V/A-type H+-transporting ATPase subunit E